MPVQTVKQPTYMRYARVEQVLSQELAFRDKLGPKKEAVLKPDGESQLFAPEIIAITQLIHNSGKDAHKCQKLDIIRAAVDMFKIVQAAPAAVEPPEPPAPPPLPPPPPPPPPPTKKTSPPKAVKPTPTPKPKAKKEAVKADPAPAKADTTEKLETTSDVKNDGKRDEAIKVAKEALTQDTNQTALNPYISMYTLVITATQNCELFDDQPDKDKRLKSLDDLANAFLRLTMSFKGAKEAKKS
jgi:hypothetical protein